MRQTILICVAILASAHTQASAQQSISAAPESPAVSLCHLTSDPGSFQDKTVRVRASLQSIYLYSYVIGLMLTSADCDPVDAHFEKAEDEQNLLNALKDAEADQAEVIAVGKFRGPRRADTDFNYGLKGVFKYQMVIESISIIRPLPQSSIEDYLKRGVARYQQRDLDGAIKDFNQAIAMQARAIEPVAATLYYNRGVARYDLQDWDAALVDFDEALKLNPDHVMAWIKRGNASLNKGDWDAAITSFDRAIRLDANSAMAWNNRGLARQHKGNTDAALADYARALELDPRLSVALNNRAGIRHDRGDLRGALDDYNQAIALDPMLALLYCNRGVTRKAMGDLRGAMNDYNEAIRLRPDFSLAYFNRGAAWKAMGKGLEAQQDFIRGMQLGEEPPEVPLEPSIEVIPARRINQ